MKPGGSMSHSQIYLDVFQLKLRNIYNNLCITYFNFIINLCLLLSEYWIWLAYEHILILFVVIEKLAFYISIV